MKQGTVGIYGSESLPNITGKTVASLSQGGMGWNSNNALYGSRTNNGYICNDFVSSYQLNDTIHFDASRSSSTYQNNAKVNPDNAEIMYVIKY